MPADEAEALERRIKELGWERYEHAVPPPRQHRATDLIAVPRAPQLRGDVRRRPQEPAEPQGRPRPPRGGLLHISLVGIGNAPECTVSVGWFCACDPSICVCV